jgi:hypothetical protein
LTDCPSGSAEIKLLVPFSDAVVPTVHLLTDQYLSVYQAMLASDDFSEHSLSFIDISDAI